MANELQNYVDGTWVDAVDGERSDVFNPATGEVAATAPHFKQADADRAIDAARPTEMPWGGYKQSGIGRELGKDGVEDYLEKKSIYINLAE